MCWGMNIGSCAARWARHYWFTSFLILPNKGLGYKGWDIRALRYKTCLEGARSWVQFPAPSQKTLSSIIFIYGYFIIDVQPFPQGQNGPFTWWLMLEERVVSLWSLQSTMKGGQGRNSGQEPEGKTWSWGRGRKEGGSHDSQNRDLLVLSPLSVAEAVSDFSGRGDSLWSCLQIMQGTQRHGFCVTSTLWWCFPGDTAAFDSPSHQWHQWICWLTNSSIQLESFLGSAGGVLRGSGVWFYLPRKGQTITTFMHSSF